MLNEALRKIYKVQKVDAAILELERRFAALDPGEKARRRYEETRAAFEAAEEKLKSLRSEAQDLELLSKQLDQKRKAEEKRLYQGGVYNIKEADAIEREIESLKKRSSDVDERLLALWEDIEPARVSAEEAKKVMEEAERHLKSYQEKYAMAKAEFEAKFAQLQAARREAIKGCDEELLQKYDQLRKKLGGIGLAPVEHNECGVCHAKVATRILEAVAKGESLERCENCGRYLFMDEKPREHSQEGKSF